MTVRRLLIALSASAILGAGATQALGAAGPIYPIPTLHQQAVFTATTAKSDAHKALLGKGTTKRLLKHDGFSYIFRPATTGGFRLLIVVRHDPRPGHHGNAVAIVNYFAPAIVSGEPFDVRAHLSLIGRNVLEYAKNHSKLPLAAILSVSVRPFGAVASSVTSQDITLK